MAANTKLIDVLQRKNPDITDHWAGSDYKNTTNPNWDQVTLTDTCREHVQPWEDFTYEAILLAYGDILQQDIKGVDNKTYRQVITPSSTPTEVVKEDDVDQLSILWTVNVVREPLKQAALELRARDPMMTAEVKGSTPNPTIISKRIEWKGKSVFKPDWSLLDRTLTKEYKAQNPAITQQLVYVHGDSKVKQKWKSEWLTLADKALQITTDPPYHKPGTPQKDYDKTHGVKHDRVRPLSQIATYCRYGETRYGYIITQTELVALRIRLFGAYTPDNPTRAAIEYKSIPWSASGNQLTVNLAIWALGCMGMNDTHRPLEGPNHTPLDGMARLTWWKKATRKNEEGYVNVISQRFVSAKEWPAFSKGKKVYLDNDPNATSKTAKFLSAEDRVPKDSRTTSGNDLAKAVKDLSLDDKNKSSTASGSASASSSSSSAKSYTKCVVNKKEYKLKVGKGKYQVSLDNGKNWYPVEQDNKKAWFVKTAPKPTPISQMI